MTRVRCAIYTRKSSEEGLEQSFNSLHAQHEACAAYVLSQASEGWNLLHEQYDDGGLSSGTLARPALQRLLADIEAGKVDIVVVYKVDRLTRSLLDFSKLVEAFDKARTSFVSVTQSFNTTTSMGRLTLNMLLSFAQFEREVTAERIRDKLAASKARGMWMGGTPPIGYRPDGRSLAIVDEHAEFVRDIFARYLALGKVRPLVDALHAEGIRSPLRTLGTGRSIGGAVLSRGQIYQMLGNPVYIGQIRHRQIIYDGLHEAIIDPDTWERAQALLSDNTQGELRTRAARPSLLAGLVHDEAGVPLLATHACKGKHRYRYYVSKDLHHRARATNHGIRIPAREIEGAVLDTIVEALKNPLDLLLSAGHTLLPDQLRAANAAAHDLSKALRAKDRPTLLALLSKVQILTGKIVIELSCTQLGAALGVPLPNCGDDTVALTSPIRLTRTGSAVRLVQSDGKAAVQRGPDPALVKLLARAHALWKRLESGEIDIRTLARDEQINDSYVSRMVRLAFLSPTIVAAIAAGEQPAQLNAALLLTSDIPADWTEQARRLGFA